MKLGNFVTIYEYCTIGGVGFGYVMEDGILVNQPHIGKVVIEDHVDIFPFTNVDKATLGTTFIGQGTKIDHFCSIGHNSHIGKNNAITVAVISNGGARMGDSNFVGARTTFRDYSVIGSRNVIGMSSSILSNLGDDELWFGSPAKRQEKK